MTTRLRFTRPLLGLGEDVDYELAPVDDVAGLYTLASSTLQLYLVDPDAFLRGYSPAVSPDELLGIGGVDDPAAYAMFAVTTLAADGPTANLMAPIIVHRETGRAAQVILSDDRYPVSVPLAA